MATKKTITCYGCGSDITHQSNNRYNLLSPSFPHLLIIWKKLAQEHFDELSKDVDLEDLLYDSDGTVGRVCHPCASVLERLRKLEELNRSTREDIGNAIAIITNESRAIVPQEALSMSRRQQDDRSSCGPTLARRCLNLANSGDSHIQMGNNVRSPDISVSL